MDLYKEGENVFWKKKKITCNHDWHHLQDTFIWNNTCGVIDSDDGCYIFCPKCNKQNLVYREEWERIKRKQDILKEVDNKMNQKSIDKVEFAKKVFTDKGIIFRELNNGQLQVDTANYWATTDKWFDPKTNTKDKGINSFIKYLKDNNII